MKQERHNIFRKTHTGLRSMLFEAGTRIQQTDFTLPKETVKTLTFIRQSACVFEYHISKEDAIIYNAVAHLAPYIVAMIEKTNNRDIRLARDIKRDLEGYQKLKSGQDQVRFGADLQAAFFEFTANVLQHLNKEETIINELLWSQYSDKELKKMEAEIISQVISEENAWYAGRLMKGLSNKEIIGFISVMIEHTKQDVAWKLVKTARAVLPIDRWQMIRGKFALPMLAA